MPLTSGTRLGTYEILAPIGSGGMGEVYRARDTKLNREVAIKVLPEHLARDPAALARFEREAQAVASLSHPNILAIHDFGVAAHVAYAVTELLEGETLRARLSGHALPARKAVEYALQIVHGIAAAHRKGVIHRDLKPENIFVKQDGRVKILDFGLAKATGSAGDGVTGLTQSAPGTSPGTVMGSVGYMSPEQVRGLPVDHRTDIFSFGVVLYEMLSGLRPFRGDSNVETMNAILKEDPPEFAVAGVSVPAALDRIVRRCMEKNADERFHSAHDLGLALETLSESGTSGQSAASMAVAALPPARRMATPWLVTAGAVAVAAAAFFAGHRLAQPTPSGPPSYHRLTFRRGPITSARYAPDGKTIVYAATWEGEPLRLYSTREESPDSLALAFPNADIASISASGELGLIMNGRTLRSYARVGTLARASLSGGAARAVLEDVQDADWLPDGSGFAASRFVDRRYRLEFPVGKTVYESGGYISDVRVSPDGALVAFLDHPILGDDRGSLAVIDRAGKKRTLAGEYSSVQGVAWAHHGGEIWFTGADTGSARALLAVTTAGALRTVTRAPGTLHLGDVGADGSVLLWSDDSRFGLIGHAKDDTKDRDLSWLDWSTVPIISHDGQTLVFTEEGDGGGPEYSVYLRSMDGSPAVRLGSGLAVARSPDGKWVLTVRLNPAPAQLVLLPTGAGEPQPVTNDALSHGAGWFTTDGTHIVYSAAEPGHRPRLYLQALSGGTATPITPEGVTGPLSPDGKLVASDGQFYPTDGGAPRPIPGFEPNDRVARWAAERGSLFVRPKLDSGDQQVFLLDAAGRRTLVHQIARVPGTVGGQWFSITPDGSAYVFTYSISQSDLFRVTGLK
jgi:Tol biopolymer transport system component/tRNA A-37 threonylcarbamoyl transferase component Bud32